MFVVADCPKELPTGRWTTYTVCFGLPLATYPTEEDLMSFSRRQFVYDVTGTLLAGGLMARTLWGASDEESQAIPIVDTHQHLWDLETVRPPWLKGAPDLLNRRYAMPEYLAATRGLNVVKAVYMEVDVDPRDHVLEAEHVIGLCRSRQHPTVAAVIGGRPDSDQFGQYIARFKGNPYVKGVRQVLHGGTPAGHCLSDEFVRGIRLLGDAGLSFDLCLRAGELKDGVKLADACPQTRFIVDHCGNADPNAFGAKSGTEKPSHDPEGWKRDMEAFAKRDNVICKISGIVARAAGLDRRRPGADCQPLPGRIRSGSRRVRRRLARVSAGGDVSRVGAGVAQDCGRAACGRPAETVARQRGTILWARRVTRLAAVTKGLPRTDNRN